MYDVVVIGAGAAGLLCAIEAGKRGKRVILIERNAQPGRKIVISGGGRCNFTNLKVGSENFISANPHFCKSALARYSPDDFIELVRKHRIPYYEKKLGQLFCRGSSHSIVEMLLAECKAAKVRLITDCGVRNIDKTDRFSVDTTKGQFESKALVIATGGLSFPKLGATGFGYDIAKQFGLRVIKTRPSLVPLRFATDDFSALSGLSLDATAKSQNAEFRENILFTHKGLSGPATLQISNYWDPNLELEFDLLPGCDVRTMLRENRSREIKIKNLLSTYLPQRFVEKKIPHEIGNKPLKGADDKTIGAAADLINSWRVRFSDTEGWHKAEVTIGGVDTNEISSKTMESNRVPGLFFIGEVLDVTGWLGGYNFQWAWSSGYACAQSL